MSDTPNLSLPLLASAQAQKHVTVNEALSLLDGLIHLSFVSRNQTAPPASPLEGDRYLIAAGATGEWSGQSGKIALRMAGAWNFVTPREGWRAWIADEDALLTFNGTNWLTASVPSTLQNLALLGVNATADTTNKVSVSSSAVLLNHAGAGMQVKLNKQSTTDTASFLFQTNFSGRAEFGATGDDSFHLKVSADGASFTEALVIANTSGLLTIRQGAVLDPAASDPATPVNGQLWYNSTTGKFRARQNNATVDVIGAGGSVASWGSITGTLSAQTDLQTALNGKAASAHIHAVADVTNLQTALNAKSDTGHLHAIADVTSLQATLNGKAAAAHTHAIADVTALQSALDAKQASLQVQDEGANLGASGTTSAINFTGAGVTVSRAANTITVNVPAAPGGGSGGISLGLALAIQTFAHFS